MWTTVEQELVREGIFKKGGYMDTLQYMKEREQMKGLQKGLRKGRQEGLQKGLQKGRQEVILNMLKEKLDITLISKLTDIPVKEVKKLKNSS